MKRTLTSFVAISALFLSLTSFKIQESGQIYFLRSTNNVGALIAYKVFIDDKLVCHLHNNKYSVHDLPAGEHTVSIQGGGLGNKAESRPIKFTVTSGKSNYFAAVNGKNLYLLEVVEPSAQELMKKLVATAQCLKEDK